MDFARKQLEKYGWSDGKGLGRHENGISEPLKPKLKRSATGLGHDAAAEINDHWWSTLYDRAASNVEVKGKTKISTKDPDAFAISSSTWKIAKKSKHPSGEFNGFVRTAVLTSGGAKTLRLDVESESDEDGNVAQITDEDLFAACRGRTAHKGARHGLRAIGKLARIEEQEINLLKLAKYKGYSQAVEDGEDPKSESKNKEGNVESKQSKSNSDKTEEGKTEHIMCESIDISKAKKGKKNRKEKSEKSQDVEEPNLDVNESTEYNDNTKDSVKQRKNKEAKVKTNKNKSKLKKCKNNGKEKLEKAQDVKESEQLEVNDSTESNKINDNVKLRKNKKAEVKTNHNNTKSDVTEEDKIELEMCENIEIPKAKKCKKNRKEKLEQSADVETPQRLEVNESTEYDKINDSVKIRKNKEAKVKTNKNKSKSDVTEKVKDLEICENLDTQKPKKNKKNRKEKLEKAQEVEDSYSSKVIECTEYDKINDSVKLRRNKKKQKQELEDKLQDAEENQEHKIKTKKRKL